MAQKPFLDVLQNRHVHRSPPLWLMRQAGRYLPEYRAVRDRAGSFLELCYNPDLATEVTLQPLRRYGFDAAILFSDILVVPDALGQKVRFLAGEGPKLPCLETRQDIICLRPSEILGRLSPVIEAVRQIRNRLPETTAFIGFCGAPWTVATYMIEGGSSRDFAKAKSWVYSQSADLEALIELLITASIDYLSAQIEAGVEAIQIFDSWAGVLPETQFRRWVIEPTKRLIEELRHRYPAIPIIGFPRGAGLLYERFVAETGCHGVSLDPMIPLDWAVKTLQPHTVLQGNLDPAALVAGGKALHDSVVRILEVLGQGPYIFNLGHGIVPETPPEHVSELVEIIRSYG